MRGVMQPNDVTYFDSPAAFREWLRSGHRERTELWVGYWKRATQRPSITWEESVEKRILGLRGALVIGAISGLVAGFVLAYMVFASPQQTAGDVLGLLLIGVVQGCATMFWLARMAQRR